MSLKDDSFKKLRKKKNKWHVDSWEEYENREDTFLKERLLSKEPTITGKIRISGGKAKNILIDIPKTTRPVTDRLKVRVFDILREDIVNKRVLDLYAGTGALALESLSRGAKSAVLVDAAKQAYRILQQNVLNTGFLNDAEVVKAKTDDFVYKAVQEKEKFDIIFVDPPYKLFNTKAIFKMERSLNQIAELLPYDNSKFKGVIVLKHPRRYPLEKLSFEKVKMFETYEFGLNAVTFLIAK